MKKMTMLIMTVCLLFTFSPMPLKAITASAPNTTATAATPPTESDVATALMTRLGEIKAMDKSNLKASEKKQLRKETRSIKRELKRLSGGAYFSIGAIIVILILLLLLIK